MWTSDKQHVYVALVFFKIEVYLIYNVVSISGIQQSDSVIQIYIYISYIYKNVFQILFHFRLLQELEYSSLWYLVEFCKQNNSFK